MAIETPAAFLEALERSNLLTDEQLATARETAKKATKAKMIAAWLVQKGWLTRWQASSMSR